MFNLRKTVEEVFNGKELNKGTRNPLGWCHSGFAVSVCVGLRVCYEVPPVEQTISELGHALRGHWTEPFIQAGGEVQL